MTTSKVPKKYLVFARYGTRPAEVPGWAWDLAHSGDDEDKAMAVYLDLKGQDPNNEVVITVQATLKLELVK